MQEKRFLLGLTTTPGSNWREKASEIQKFRIKEIALFPTFLKITERKELYSLLEKTCLKEIPHVHLRDDMEDWEIDFFIKKYQTEAFNIHTKKIDFSYSERFPELKNNFFVENPDILSEDFFDLIKIYGGVCFDISHFYDFGFLQKHPSYQNFTDFLKKNRVGCCHISAISKNPRVDSMGFKNYSNHFLKELHEIDYVKDYIEHLPAFSSIELENSFEEQMEIKKRLEKFINKLEN